MGRLVCEEVFCEPTHPRTPDVGPELTRSWAGVRKRHRLPRKPKSPFTQCFRRTSAAIFLNQGSAEARAMFEIGYAMRGVDKRRQALMGVAAATIAKKLQTAALVIDLQDVVFACMSFQPFEDRVYRDCRKDIIAAEMEIIVSGKIKCSLFIKE